jgi:hypothetical protein
MSPELYAPLARILLRYVAGALIAKGVIQDPAQLVNPDTVTVVTIGLGALLSAVSEGFYMLARRRGWGR